MEKLNGYVEGTAFRDQGSWTLSYPVGKSIFCRKRGLSVAESIFSYLAGPRGGLNNTRGRLRFVQVLHKLNL